MVPRLETPIPALAVEVDNGIEVALRDDPGLAQAASKSTVTTAINLIRSPYTIDDEAARSAPRLSGGTGDPSGLPGANTTSPSQIHLIQRQTSRPCSRRRGGRAPIRKWRGPTRRTPHLRNRSPLSDGVLLVLRALTSGWRGSDSGPVVPVSPNLRRQKSDVYRDCCSSVSRMRPVRR